MSIYCNWNLNPIITDLLLENVSTETILRTNYFNNGCRLSNYYDENNSIILHSKFSSKNICDYYKGFSIINDGLYKNHLVDPSSLHIWDSTFENDQEVLSLRQKILRNINAEIEDYKICLPINFNSNLYCYVQIGKNCIPSSRDLTYLNDSINSIKVFNGLNLAYPKLDFNFAGFCWYEKHFPIFINTDLYVNSTDCDYVKLIYFYYQRQNPYIEKKYILSRCDNLFCDFYLNDFESICSLRNQYLIYDYGYSPNIYCPSFNENGSNGCYSGAIYSGEFIGSLSSQIKQGNYINFNNIYTSLDFNGNVYDFQQRSIDVGDATGYYFYFCKSNFFTNFCCDVKDLSSIWYLNTADFYQQHHGLPNLDVYSENNTNPLISSDYFSEIKCKNVII